MGDKTKHLVRVGHEFAAAMSDETPIITIAKMVTELASALDVQSARSDALAAENAALEAICEDRRTFIMNGVQLGYIQVPTVETDLALETIRIAVSPQEPTPATDAWMNEQRAVGADLTKQQIEAAMKSCYQDEQIGLIEAAEIAGSFAAQLRGSQV